MPTESALAVIFCCPPEDSIFTLLMPAVNKCHSTLYTSVCRLGKWKLAGGGAILDALPIVAIGREEAVVAGFR